MFQGEIHETGNRDWVRIDLEAGITYEIDLKGVASGVGTLTDPVLAIYNSSGNYITGNDDGGTGNESHVSYTPVTSGTYYLMARGYAASTGTYLLSATPDLPPPPVGTLNDLASYLTHTYWSDTNSTPHSFDTSSSTVISVDITGLTAAGQQLARWAMEAWEAVANLSFAEVTGGAQITFDDANAGAVAGTTYDGNGHTQSATINVSTQWLADHGTQLGSYSFQTYMHELGHALGLGHQGNYDGSGVYGTDADFANDSWQMSVMSYFSQTANTAITATQAEAVTAMAADVLAIQSLYGVVGTGTLTGGATTYGMGHSLGNSWLGQIFDAQNGAGSSATVEAGPFALTIYDRNGRDTIDFSNDTADQTINLTFGGISDVYGATGNLVIARGTLIENYHAGSGNDDVTGNRGKNTFIGNDGDDTLDGFHGDDALEGGAGNDTLLGGHGDDRLDGGDGDDTLEGGHGDDVLISGAGVDLLNGGQGTDLVDYWAAQHGVTVDLRSSSANTGAAAGDSYVSIEDIRGTMKADTLKGTGQANDIFAAQGNDLIDGRAGDDVLDGAGGRDILFGRAGNDTLLGGNGGDRIYAGTGDDVMTGGGSRDTFYFQAGSDVITDFDQDLLRFDDALWGGGAKSKAQLSTYGSLSGVDLVFDFGAGNTLTLENYTDLDAIESSLGYY